MTTTRAAPSARGIQIVRPLAAALLTVAMFGLILRRVPFTSLAAALHDADYRTFLALMIPNTLFYFAWDTLVLTVVVRWFHGPVSYRDLLPVRAASYVVGFFNTNLGRGALAIVQAPQHPRTDRERSPRHERMVVLFAADGHPCGHRRCLGGVHPIRHGTVRC